MQISQFLTLVSCLYIRIVDDNHPCHVIHVSCLFLVWIQTLIHFACSCSSTSWCCAPESTNPSSSCIKTGRWDLLSSARGWVCLHCGIFQLASITSTFAFCLSGAQKSVPAAQLCVLHCTLPLLSQPAVRHGLWRKQQAKTKGWPDAAERSHNVSWRLLNPLSGFPFIHHITGVSSHISSDFCSCKYVCCSLNASSGSLRCAARHIRHITCLLWSKESNGVMYDLTVLKMVFWASNCSLFLMGPYQFNS